MSSGEIFGLLSAPFALESLPSGFENDFEPLSFTGVEGELPFEL
jgi:hypothetical protein